MSMHNNNKCCLSEKKAKNTISKVKEKKRERGKGKEKEEKREKGKE